MSDQEKKDRILNRLKNIVYFILGITVLFLSIQSIIQANGKLDSISINAIWLLLSLIVIIEGIIGIKKDLNPLTKLSRNIRIIDWILILGSIISANIFYLLGENNLIIISIIILIASSIPIKIKDN